MAVAMAGAMAVAMVGVMAVAMAMEVVVAVAVAGAVAVAVAMAMEVAMAVAKAMAVVNFFLLEKVFSDVKFRNCANVFSGCFCGLYGEPEWPRSGADCRSAAVVLGRGCEPEPDGYDRHNFASGLQISDRCGSGVAVGGNRDPRL